MKKSRREAREYILQILFHLDFNPTETGRILKWFWKENPCGEEVSLFVERVINGIAEKQKDLDALISKYSENWKIHRMGAVDRNVLRMALYEMLYCDDIPPVVSINEAVDIAKYFSNKESGSFVNGILDRVMETLPRDSRKASDGSK